MGDAIAIIGIGVRFPGGATSAKELWRILTKGESQWSEFPKDRLNLGGYYHPSGDRQGSISFRGAHFLQGDVTAFDASFFAVAGDEAKAIDPQQRMLLEVSYEAIENAGLRKENIEGSDTSVYMGSFVKDYEQICLRDPDWQPKYAATGNGMAIMANRISYAFNFHGPSMTIDTGCSGSLVAVHLAAQSLQTGEASMAMAGGVGLILTPSTIMPMTALNFLSPDGKCYTFDSRANGYGRGEGVGIVVMKRLADALHDGDPIRAVIRGSRVNQDGRTTGITLPSKEAQIANILAVYRDASLPLDQTGYVECHGTGTQAGDWRELKAISETIASERRADNPVVVGSIKPNIGHLEGAAGVAGLIKSVLILENGKIPRNINFEKGNPNINFQDWKVKVPQQLLDWPLQGIRRISVNCFGFGGTNAHVIVDEAPNTSLKSIGRPETKVVAASSVGSPQASIKSGLQKQSTPRLFCYSSHDKLGVGRIVTSHLQHLQSRETVSAADYLRDYSYTLGYRRSQFEWRAFIVAETMSELLSCIGAFDQNLIQRSSSGQLCRICLLFGGQGTQWAQMGKDLMRFEKYRLSLWDASYHLKTRLGASFDLLEELLRSKETSHLSDPILSQPAITAIQLALVELLFSFGIRPRHVIGHSSGEIAAAFAAGALTREDAWELAYYRGLAAATIPVLAPTLKGGMIAVGLSQPEADLYLSSISQRAQVACINSSHLTTLSGRYEAIQYIANDLTERNIFHRVLGVTVAYHSSHMKLIEPDYKALIRHISPRHFATGIRMFSTVTGREVLGTELDADYWARNLVSPVQYLAAMEGILNLSSSERPSILLEISPRSTLRAPTMDTASKICPDATIYRSLLDLKTRDITSVLRAVGDLWCRGCAINIGEVISQASKGEVSGCLTDLPPYPWNHDKSYWHESHLDKAIRFREYPRQDLIGAPTADSTPFNRRWRGFIRLSENPWLQQHQIQKTTIYPAAGMVSMVLEASKQIVSKAKNIIGFEILDMKIDRAMIIPDTAHGLEVTLHVNVMSHNAEDLHASREFSIFSKPLDKPWERHATGTLRFRSDTGEGDVNFRSCVAQFSELDKHCNEKLIPRQLYELLDVVGINYGPLFQNIVSIRKHNNSCVSEVQIPDTRSCMPGKFEYPHLIHPATLDSMFQTLFVIKPVPMVPMSIKRIFISSSISSGTSRYSSPFRGYATALRHGFQGAEGTLFMMQESPTTAYVHASGLNFVGVPDSNVGFLPNYHNLCSEIIWKEDVLSLQPETLIQLVESYAHKCPGLAVLQVGGSWSLSNAILKAIAPKSKATPSLLRFTFVSGSDGGASDLLSAVQGGPLQAFVEVRTLDSLNGLPGYHLIVASSNTDPSDDDLKPLLQKGGMLLRELSATSYTSSYVANSATVPTTNGDIQHACSVVEHCDPSTRIIQKYSIHSGPHVLPRGLDAIYRIILLVPYDYMEETVAFRSFLHKSLSDEGRYLDIIELRIEDILDDMSVVQGNVVVSLLDAYNEKLGSIYSWDESSFEMFKILHTSARAVIWLTKGANMIPCNPKCAPIIALARTLMSEDPLKKFVTIDLGMDSCVEGAPTVEKVISILHYTVDSTTALEPRDMEFAIQEDKIFIPRLRPISTLNRLIEDDGDSEVIHRSLNDFRSSKRSDIGLCLHISEPGLCGSNLYFTKVPLEGLRPDEVEILFEGAPLMKADWDTVMGHSTHTNLGMDLFGRVGRVGSQVTQLSIGDCVCVLTSNGAFKDSSHVDARWVKRYQTGFIPSVHISAYYGLVHIGRAAPGRRVLIHTGASAAGLAAIDIGLITGAEVFATVTGADSHEQKELLISRGLPKDHILKANSNHLVDLIRSLTRDKGVDVVYNPSQGNVEADFQCIRSCGSIIHLTDDSINAAPFKASLGSTAFVSLSLRRLVAEDAEFISELFDLTSNFLSGHDLEFMASPKVRKFFPLESLEAALEHTQAFPNIGYAMASVAAPMSDRLLLLKDNVMRHLADTLDSGGTYVLAGGLGGLGRSISDLLISNGVRHLAMISRSGASSADSQAWVSQMIGRGIDIRLYTGDICETCALELIVNTISAEMPPIRGVFQCAAVLKDAVFDNMTWTDWSTAFRPKAIGSWNLVEGISAVAQDPFFIFLSSSAGVIGNRGQANYSAGNCFQDALARNLRLRGKHAISVDLGPILGAGMLAEDDTTLDMLRASGFYGIRHEDFLRVITHAITMEIQPDVPMPAQVILGVGTGGIFHQNKPADPYWFNTAMYSYLNLVDMPPPDLSSNSSSSTRNQDMKSRLGCSTDVSAATNIIMAGLVKLLAKSMTMLPEEIDVNRPPTAYGVDSLVAVGVRSWILSNCSVQVSVFEILCDNTVTELAGMIAEKGGYGRQNE